MATNYVQEGKVIAFTAGSDYSSGDVVVIGGLLGVVLADVANGETGQAQISGVFTVPKVSAAVLTEGMRVQWDVSAAGIEDAAATPASGDLVNCGIAVEAAGNGVTTCKILLNAAGATITA